MLSVLTMVEKPVFFANASISHRASISVSSFFIIMQDAFKKCDGFYAGSFKDMARVAKINPYLWTELFKINKEVLTEQIDEYINTLNIIKEAVNSDNKELFDILLNSKELKEWQDENYKN